MATAAHCNIGSPAGYRRDARSDVIQDESFILIFSFINLAKLAEIHWQTTGF
jgi:hypothetical protein